MALLITYKAVCEDHTKYVSSSAKKLDTSVQTAQNLILEQIRLWDFSGQKTGSYYAQQHNWTMRARRYVTQLKNEIRIKKDVKLTVRGTTKKRL